jgi:hypothetical protein
MWYLHGKVILTKDNLANFFWQRNKYVVFFIKRQYNILFMACPLAKVVWCIVYIAFNIVPPNNITNTFRNWLRVRGISKNDKGQIQVGVCALLWQYGM